MDGSVGLIKYVIDELQDSKVSLTMELLNITNVDWFCGPGRVLGRSLGGSVGGSPEAIV